MSETLPDSYIEQLKARDTRFTAVAAAIAIETDLRDNLTIRKLMDAARQDAEQAMREVVQISPANVEQVAFCQMKIRTLTYIRDVLDIVMRRGAIAEQEIRNEDSYDE
jgi:hypothetical protein